MNIKDPVKHIPFSRVNVNDPFFDSLRKDYGGFNNWFNKKAVSGEKAYVLFSDDGSAVLGFLYLKDETESDNSILPNFDVHRRLKIGTFKVKAHHTVFGERFMTIVLRKMIEGNFDTVYVTTFSKQEGLISLFKRFGFEFWGKKENGELVYTKTLKVMNDFYKDFPRINVNNAKYYILSIYPKYHTDLFPDSQLYTEKNHVIRDVSYTNTINKVYLGSAPLISNMDKGDLVVIYRTSENGKKAEYNSVVTGICTVVDTKNIREFETLDSFKDYCGKGTIFSNSELERFYNERKYPYVIKMIYNFPLSKRIIRKYLCDEIGIPRSYPTMEINRNEFLDILKSGEINENFIIN